MNPENVIQILGVIVQAYAGILAIGAGFFTFQIQRLREELRSTEEKIDKNIDTIIEIFAPYGMWRKATNFRASVKRNDPEWIDKELRRIREEEDIQLRLSEGHLQAVENLRMEFPGYSRLKKSENMPYKLFSGFLLFCSLVIVLSLVSMGLIDAIVQSQVSNEIVWFIEGIASAGVLYVAIFGWSIATISR